MRVPRLLALLLVLVIAGLAPATYADPPDPSWLGGYWDDDDFDDVVILLNGTVAIVQTLVLDAAPPGEVVALVESADAVTIPATVDETASPRAPPLLLALQANDHRIVARHQ